MMNACIREYVYAFIRLKAVSPSHKEISHVVTVEHTAKLSVGFPHEVE